MLCELALGTRCLLVLMCGITAKALKIWVQVEQRPRAVDTSVVVSHWPSEKRSLESWEKTALSMAEKKVTPSIVVRYLVQGWWPRAMDSLQMLISKSKISYLGGIIVTGIAVAERLWGGWICKHSLLPLPAPGTPAPAPLLGELFPVLPRACRLPAHSPPPCLPLPQLQLFGGLSCWPLTHLDRQYDYTVPVHLCAWACAFFCSRFCTFLLFNALTPQWRPPAHKLSLASYYFWQKNIWEENKNEAAYLQFLQWEILCWNFRNWSCQLFKSFSDFLRFLSPVLYSLDIESGPLLSRSHMEYKSSDSKLSLVAAREIITVTEKKGGPGQLKLKSLLSMQSGCGLGHTSYWGFRHHIWIQTFLFPADNFWSN